MSNRQLTSLVESAFKTNIVSQTFHIYFQESPQKKVTGSINIEIFHPEGLWPLYRRFSGVDRRWPLPE